MRYYTHGIAGRTMSPYLLFAVSVVPSLAVGYGSWWLVERWFVGKERYEELLVP
jgi:peptidoglycan/LPS O-acetylase OafA/YrhL